MRAGWYVVRAEARARRGSLAALMVVVGLAAGLVLASASGARRSDTAYERFLQAANASHVLISSESDNANYEPLRAVEGVAGVAPIAGLELFAEDLGVPASSPTAWGWLAVAIAGTLVVSNAAAGVPGWRARHLRLAVALRAE